MTKKIRVHGNPDEIFKNFSNLMRQDEKNREIYMHPEDQLKEMYEEAERHYDKVAASGDELGMKKWIDRMIVISAEEMKTI